MMEEDPKHIKLNITGDSNATSVYGKAEVNVYPPRPLPPPPGRAWSVPYPHNRFFLGQETLFNEIHQNLHGSTTVAATPIQAISGLGGIGKTQHALEYAHRYRKDYPYVFWIRADHRTKLITDLANLADLLNLPQQDKPEQMKVVAAVLQWLETNQGWLLIYDNVDDLELLTEFMPTHNTGAILLTTRLTQTQPLAKPLIIQPLDEYIGAELLLRRAHLLEIGQPLENAAPSDQHAARQICRLVGGLPLALDQAGAYIDATKCTVQQYLKWYQEKQQNRVSLLHQRGEQDVGHPEAVANTWALSFRRVEEASQAAANLLRACAFLDPDIISEEFLRANASCWSSELEEIAGDDFQWNETLRHLLWYALMSRNREQPSLSMHRLVQTVIKDALDESVAHEWRDSTIHAVQSAFPDGTAPTNWETCKHLLPHALRCAELIAQEDVPALEPDILLVNMANYLKEMARYEEAEPLYQLALHRLELAFSPDYPYMAYPLNGLAIIYRTQGKYDQAEPLYQRVLQIWERDFGPEHPELASPLNGLANLYVKQGKYFMAGSLYQRTLRITEQRLGSEHPEVASTLSNMGNLYKTQKMYPIAEGFYKRALRIWEQQSDFEHPGMAFTLNALANLYRDQGKYDLAEPLYQQALRICEQYFSPDHPVVASTLNELVNLYMKQEKYAQAEPLYQHTLRLTEQQFGPEHPEVVSPLNELANLYRTQGKYEEAEPLYQRALRIAEQQLDLEHPDVASTLNGLANLYQEQGKYAQAEQCYLRALHIWEQRLGPEHPEIAYLLTNLARLYTAQKKYDQAEPLYQRALRIWEQQLNPDQSQVASMLNGLANLYAIQEKDDQAEPLYQRALLITEQELGPDHPKIITPLNGLAILYAMQEKYAQAEQLYRRALLITEQESGSSHPKLLTPLLGLINLYTVQEKFTKAEQLYQWALRIAEQELGSGHPLTQHIQNNYAIYKW